MRERIRHHVSLRLSLRTTCRPQRTGSWSRLVRQPSWPRRRRSHWARPSRKRLQRLQRTSRTALLVLLVAAKRLFEGAGDIPRYVFEAFLVETFLLGGGHQAVASCGSCFTKPCHYCRFRAGRGGGSPGPEATYSAPKFGESLWGREGDLHCREPLCH
jgi:hypothetical protein